MNTRGYGQQIRQGFTLIELLVVLAIMSLITFVLLEQQGKFDSSTVLRSLAYNVGISMRQAQIYGTSVFGATNTGVVVYAPAYGLYFSASTTQSYLLFADTYPATTGNGRYDPGQDSVTQTFTLGGGYSIAGVCARGVNSVNAAVTDCSPGTISSLELLFKRPNPDAQIVALNASGNPTGNTYSEGYVIIKSTEGTTRAISVSVTGEIVVWPPNTTPTS